MAYAILRHNGVDVGKMDFLGPSTGSTPETVSNLHRLDRRGGTASP
jgi:hypothetical protein